MKFNNIYFKPYKDQFNIYNLIKKINPNYRLYINNKTNKFAIVNIINNFEICKEFDSFSENILQDLRFSKIENLNKVIEFIEENNVNLQKKENKNKLSLISDLTSRIINFLKRSNSISSNDVKKIIGEQKC